MRIIIAIDILGGKCVRLEQGNFSQVTVYSDSPHVVAKKLEDAGIKYLHLVDLDAAREGKIINHRILEQIASNTSLKIDFGGGIRSDNDIKAAFSAGAYQVNCGSVAVRQREKFLEWLSIYGSEKIILSADSAGRMIATHGWTEGSGKDVVGFIKDFSNSGVKYVVCTDISRDGMLQGPSTELYREILSQCRINLIASGGISSLNDLQELKNAGCEGAIIGKAFYEGLIKPEELAQLC